MRRQSIAITLAVIVSALLASPGGAVAGRVHLGRSVYRLSLEGTNGYRLRLSTYLNNTYHRVSLTAENEAGQFARYSVEGLARGGRIDATFPRLGEIKVRMHRGRVKELPPPKGCGRPTTIESGAFEGTINFRGEKGFTSVEADRAAGSIERSPRQECAPTSMPITAPPLSSTDAGALPPKPPSHFNVLQLSRGSLEVVAEGVYGTTKASFGATAHERRDGMGITRVSPTVSSEGDLEVNGTLTGALLAPPAPFLGTAAYSGPERETGCEFPCPTPEGRLTGSLRLPLPGLGIVPLTGPGVAATLYEQTIEY